MDDSDWFVALRRRALLPPLHLVVCRLCVHTGNCCRNSLVGCHRCRRVPAAHRPAVRALVMVVRCRRFHRSVMLGDHRWEQL